MRLGIKVGLKGNSYIDIDQAQPDFCEVWFHSGKIDQYHDLLTYINKTGSRGGLHFWGALADGTLANFSYPDREVLKVSLELAKKTIDTAAQYNSLYVNVHPGGARLATVNFDAEKFGIKSESVPFEQSRQILGESMSELASYAKNRGVPLYLESVPRLAPSSFYGEAARKTPLELGELPLDYYDNIFDIDNLYFTNDFGHTGANIISADRRLIFDYILEKTHQYFAKTKLLHVGFLIPPFNGTDYHGLLSQPIVKTNDAVPNWTQLKQLLGMFKERADVGALVEPEKDHVGNFLLLKELLN